MRRLNLSCWKESLYPYFCNLCVAQISTEILYASYFGSKGTNKTFGRWQIFSCSIKRLVTTVLTPKQWSEQTQINFVTNHWKPSGLHIVFLLAHPGPLISCHTQPAGYDDRWPGTNANPNPPIASSCPNQCNRHVNDSSSLLILAYIFQATIMFYGGWEEEDAFMHIDLWSL